MQAKEKKTLKKQEGSVKAINLKSQGLDTLERICNPQKICFYLTEFILKLILELEITTK